MRTARESRWAIRLASSISVELFGVLLVRVKQGQTALQQRFQLGILRIRNERVAECGVDRLIIGHLVVDVSLVKGGTVQARELLTGGVRLFGSGFGWWDCLPA